jgi:hypothetical protein
MVAIQLIKKLLALKRDIVLTGFDALVGEVFKGLHFREMEPLHYISLRPGRLDPFSLPFRRFYRLQKRWPAFRRIAESGIKLSRRYSYPSVRAAFYRSVSERAEKALKGVQWRELSKIERSAANSQSLCGNGAYFPRNAEVINWMLAEPWIREGAAPTQPPYYFSEAYDRFRYIVLAIGESKGQSAGFVVLSVVNEKGETKLKVLDRRYCEGNSLALFWLTCLQAARFQADEMELPWEWQDHARTLPFPSMLLKSEQRRYLCHPSSEDSPLFSALGSLTLDLSDGDCAFT